MEKIFITAVILYAFFVAIYLFRLKLAKRRKKDIVGKGSIIHEIGKPQSDIVGKSKFDLSQAVSSTADSQKNKEEADSSGISLHENKEQTDIEDIDYLDDDDYDDEYIEEEGIEVEGAAQAMLASGISFDGLEKAINTVDTYEYTSPEERNEAGKSLLEVHQTDMLEQIVSGKPNRADIIPKLLATALSAYHKKLDENSGVKKENKIIDFDIYDFV